MNNLIDKEVIQKIIDNNNLLQCQVSQCAFLLGEVSGALGEISSLIFKDGKDKIGHSQIKYLLQVLNYRTEALFYPHIKMEQPENLKIEE